MLEKILTFFRPKAPPALLMVLENIGGGVHKRVDENRELLELLQQKAPQLLAECPWVNGWLRGNDEFFCALESLATSLGVSNPGFARGPGFPRSWPEQPEMHTNAAWIEHAYPLQQVAIHLQGTRHSHRHEVISLLEAVLSRLREGEIAGEEHDDDFGYRFSVASETHGPSFFAEPAGSN
ncbi:MULTISPECIES: hypothetical protein [Delftia]|uniref:hypothetical protein n=1 Tax=Delftia TaxID=80865 RepID=UPI001ABF21DF|nr:MULTISPECIES: hypothetical protein [Delftia]